MLKFIEEKLSAFKTCFTRTATYRWFVVVIVGLMTRTDFLGVTSLIRCLVFIRADTNLFSISFVLMHFLQKH